MERNYLKKVAAGFAVGFFVILGTLYITLMKSNLCNKCYPALNEFLSISPLLPWLIRSDLQIIAAAAAAADPSAAAAVPENVNIH